MRARSSVHRFALIGLCAACAGCPAEREGRGCDDVILDHPVADEWFDYDDGDQIRMFGPNAAAVYSVMSVEDETPVPQIGGVGDDDVACFAVRNIVIGEMGSDARLRIRLRQRELEFQTAAEEFLTVAYYGEMEGDGLSESSVETFLGNFRLAPLDVDETAGEADLLDENSSLEQSIELGPETYEVAVITQTANDGASRYFDQSDRIEAITIAEGFGVVAIERPDVGPLYLDELIRAAPDR